MTLFPFPIRHHYEQVLKSSQPEDAVAAWLEFK